MAKPFKHRFLRFLCYLLPFLWVAGHSYAQNAPVNLRTIPDEEVHRLHWEDMRNRAPANEEAWTEYWTQRLKISEEPDTTFDETRELADKERVFAWYPAYMGSAYKRYQFNLTSDLIYMGYHIDGNTGLYKDSLGWANTPLIDYAWGKNNALNMWLATMLYGEADLTSFLVSNDARNTFINTIKAELSARKDSTLKSRRTSFGLVLDAPGVPLDLKDQFTTFVKQLHAACAADTIKLAMTLPPAFVTGGYDIAELNKMVDIFLVQGHGFRGNRSQTAGPISPLEPSATWGEIGIAKTVSNYLMAGIDTSKVILELGLYGQIWDMQSPNIPGNVLRTVNWRTFRYIKNSFNEQPFFDGRSSSEFYNYLTTQNIQRQLWYDDSLAYSAKLKWVKQQKLGGVALWALGYEQGTTTVWNAIESELGEEGKCGVSKKRFCTHWMLEYVKIELPYFDRRLDQFFGNGPVNTFLLSPYLTFLAIIIAPLAWLLSLFWNSFRVTITENKGSISGIGVLALCAALFIDSPYVMNCDISAIQTFFLLLCGTIIGILLLQFLNRVVFRSGDLP